MCRFFSDVSENNRLDPDEKAREKNDQPGRKNTEGIKIINPFRFRKRFGIFHLKGTPQFNIID